MRNVIRLSLLLLLFSFVEMKSPSVASADNCTVQQNTTCSQECHQIALDQGLPPRYCNFLCWECYCFCGTGEDFWYDEVC
jgi:hypothetical protein